MNRILLYVLAVLPQWSIGQSMKSPKWAKPTMHDRAVKISVPEGNFFYLNKSDGYGTAFGFLGLSIGFEYYFSNKFNLNADIGTLTDFVAPFPAPVDYMGSYDRSFAFYGDIQIGTDFRRFHFDAGFQYYKTSYIERETVELFPNYIDTLKYSKKQGNLGLAFSTYFKLTKTLQLGINYYPSFLVIDDNSTTTHYGHLLFFELIFRIKTHRSSGVERARQAQDSQSNKLPHFGSLFH